MGGRELVTHGEGEEGGRKGGLARNRRKEGKVGGAAGVQNSHLYVTCTWRASAFGVRVGGHFCTFALLYFCTLGSLLELEEG